MRFAFIQAEKASYPVHGAVPGAGGVDGPGTTPGARDRRRAREGGSAAWPSRSGDSGDERRRYGSPRVHAELQARGYREPGSRVARLMREAGLRGEHAAALSRDDRQSAHPDPVAPNLVARQFDVATRATDQAWAADITYIPTGEGWLYLAVMLDLVLAPRRRLGACSDPHAHDLALDALAHGPRAPRPPAAG